MVTAAVGPSVVHIEVERHAVLEDSRIAKILDRQSMKTSDQGSGVVIDADGYILTNDHVIAGGEQIAVTLSDGRRKPAEVVGVDALTDLALLKIDADRLIPIVWGDSDRCKVGSPVWAVGSPFGLDRTVTFGILSGKHRMVQAKSHYQDFMQSDVAVNPGNSGGPLVDARGTLVGINTAIVGDTYRGVSFSIPSSVAKRVYARLRAIGRVERAWLGVQLAEVGEEELVGTDRLVRGAAIRGLAGTDSPAAKAGLVPGDIVVSVDDQRIRDVGHLMRVIGNADAGTTVRVGVIRQGEPLRVSVRLDARPAELN
jgi:S1-C subfamily serine protease